MHQISGPILADTPEKIQAFRLLALKAALKLEVIGMKHRHVNAYRTIQKEFGLKGTKAEVLRKFTEILQEKFPGVVK